MLNLLHWWNWCRKSKNIAQGWKLNNLTSVIHYSLGASSNYSLFFKSSCWLFIIHNRFRVQRIALVKFRFNYNTFGNNITQLVFIRCHSVLTGYWLSSTGSIVRFRSHPGDFPSVQSGLNWSCLWRRLSSAYIHRYLPWTSFCWVIYTNIT